MDYPKQLAFISKDYSIELQNELEFLKTNVLHKTSSVLWVENDGVEPAWAQCIWRDVKHIEIESIGDAQEKLKAISPTWRYHGGLLHRRGALIAEKLDLFLETEKYIFTRGVVKKPPPAFTIAEPNLLFYSHHVSRPSLSGEMHFKENKTTPPSRAYLKLWEALTLLGDWPTKLHRVVDLGSSPGSWTWALGKLGATVLSIDRAALDPQLSTFKNVTFQVGDAFAFKPEKMDWVFSDVICYPEKLLDYVKSWIASGLCEKFVCSIKFTGKPDPRIIHQFRQLPHSRVLHLTANKNEVTWISHPKIK
jgi:23S rRNA (cytidine2498-2'-O)-methyltransferase